VSQKGNKKRAADRSPPPKDVAANSPRKTAIILAINISKNNFGVKNF
jgi:hypothetical protein